MAFNVTDLSAELSRNGIMRNNKFLVQFPIPPAIQNNNIVGKAQLTDTNRVMSLYCEATNLPGVATLMEEVRRYGYGPNEKRPYAPIFTDVTMTFRGDAKGNVWNLLNAWLKSAISFENRTGVTTLAGPLVNQYPYEVGYKTDYAVDVNIQMFDEAGNLKISVMLREAFPIFIGDIPLNWASRSDYMRIPVTLSFFDWFNNLTSTDNTSNNPTPSEFPV